MASAVYDRRVPGYRMDPVLGEVYREIPSNADDLTEISGIGTREAVALNRMGVYFFSQIAHWQDRQVAAFASELGMTESAIADKRWLTQARMLMSNAAAAVPAAPLLSSGSTEAAAVLAAPVSSLPASATRTLTLLVFALLLGCFAVYAFNGESSEPIVGVLAADTTSLRVPADARLTELNVAPGDEVFTGEILLTLEKTEHLNQIAAQERAVRRLQNELSEAEQRAKMELKWRGRSLENELAEIRSRVERIRQVSEEKQRVAAQFSKYEAARATEESIKTVSSQKEIGARRGRVNTLLFINGRSDVAKLKSAATAPPEVKEPRPRPTFDLVQARAEIALLEAEADSLARRGERLERIRQELPEQVNSAAGVTRLAAQCAMASDTLDSMRRASRRVEVLSPSYGTVTQVNYRDGDLMERGAELIRILHTNRRYVIVHAPTRRLHELQPGSEVRLVFPGHEDCTGIVQDVPIVAQESSATGESIVSVRVEATGRHWPELPIGSQVDIVLP